MKSLLITACVLGLTNFAGLSPASAALGENYRNAAIAVNAVGPVGSGARLAAARPTAAPLYQSHETQLPNGTLVREFATLQGLVFAVTWQGPTLPNLRELLGQYFSNFSKTVEQARAQGQRGSAVNLRTSELVP
jgi:Protein of unknown function (DUF2844)